MANPVPTGKAVPYPSEGPQHAPAFYGDLDLAAAVINPVVVFGAATADYEAGGIDHISFSVFPDEQYNMDVVVENTGAAGTVQFHLVNGNNNILIDGQGANVETTAVAQGAAPATFQFRDIIFPIGHSGAGAAGTAPFKFRGTGNNAASAGRIRSLRIWRSRDAQSLTRHTAQQNL